MGIHLILHFDLRAFVKKKGRNTVTVDDLVRVITPKGRGEDFRFSSLWFSFQTIIGHMEAGSNCISAWSMFLLDLGHIVLGFAICSFLSETCMCFSLSLSLSL